jgi:hypothetical protein
VAEKEEFGGGEVVMERFCGAEKHFYVLCGSVGRVVEAEAGVMALCSLGGCSG